MTTATFPGNGNYYAQLDAWRSGFTVYCRLTVYKTSGSGYWTNTPQSFASRIGDQYNNGSWTYDFRNYSNKIVVEWSRTFSGPGDVSVGANATMDGFGTAGPADIVVNIPPNPPAAPNKPTIVRASDTSQAVAWHDNATVAAPYAYLQVQRRVYDGAWQNFIGIAGDGVYNTSSNDRSYGDTGTVANRIYVYRIYVNNGAGEAYSAESNWVFTSPAAPSGVTATKQPSGSIVLTWTKGTPHTEINSNIDYSIDGGTTWTSLATGIAGNVSTYTHTTPPAAASIMYRVRHTIVTTAPSPVGAGLTSGYGQSNSVGLTAPPNPPSALTPNGVAFDATTAQDFTWQHNTVDSSSQTAYELQYRIGTGAWTSTGKVTSTVSKRTIAASTLVNGNQYQWQVRTWGAHANPSDWSPVATVTASAVPQVTITSPGTSLGAATVTATWTYSDSEGTAQSAWEAQLLQAGTIIESLSGSGAATSAAFTTRLTDATSYQIKVRARDGSLLWSAWAQQSFTTSFPTPAVPTISVQFVSDTGTVSINVINPGTGPSVVTNWILRSLDGGQTWEQVATTPANGIGFDREAPLNTSIQYKAVAWTALPSSSESAVSTITTSTIIGYWSAGVDYQSSVQVRLNQRNPPKLDLDFGLNDKVLHYFAGRNSPVETTGTATSRSGKMEFVVTNLDDRDLVRQMSLLPAPHLIRMPDATTIYASIGPVSERRLAEGWYQISFKVTEVSE